MHEPRTTGASDHTSVIANIDVQDEDAYTTDNDADGNHISEITPLGNLQARFDIAPGSLPDMTFGLNGRNFVQQFRPTHFTAQWAGGVLKEVRIWGPRLLQDGSLGKRELDHRWKGTVAAGGVDYSDLPPSVAARLRSYLIANNRAGPPQ